MILVSLDETGTLAILTYAIEATYTFPFLQAPPNDELDMEHPPYLLPES